MHNIIGNMNNVMHEQLNKLRLISKLKEGQSLYTKDGISVYEFSYLNWIWRKWYNDNKDEVVRYMQDFYRSVDQSVDTLTSDIYHANVNSNEIKKKKLIDVAINLAEKIKASFMGIENLSKTYVNYPKTISVLDGLIQDYAITTYKQLLEYIPKDKLSKDLRENVTYNGVLVYQGYDENQRVDSIDLDNSNNIDEI